MHPGAGALPPFRRAHGARASGRRPRRSSCAAGSPRSARSPSRPPVDATNYVLWDTGQPLHAFDFDKLAGGLLIIRKARKGEKLVTLDGVERVLESSDVVVADAERAGVAGRDHGRPRHGRDRRDDATCCSRRRGGTRRPSGARPGASGCTRTRRTASSAARTSTRSPDALNLAARLLVESSGGTVAPGLLDVHGKLFRDPPHGAAPRAAAPALRRLAPRPRLRRGGARPPRLHARAQGQAPVRLDPALPHGRAPRGRPRRGSPPGLRLRPPAHAPAARGGRRRGEGAAARRRRPPERRGRGGGPLRDGQLPVRRPRRGRAHVRRLAPADRTRRSSRSPSSIRSTRRGGTCARRCCRACSTRSRATCATAPASRRSSRSAARSAPAARSDKPESLRIAAVRVRPGGRPPLALERPGEAAAGRLLRRQGPGRGASSAPWVPASELVWKPRARRGVHRGRGRDRARRARARCSASPGSSRGRSASGAASRRRSSRARSSWTRSRRGGRPFRFEAYSTLPADQRGPLVRAAQGSRLGRDSRRSCARRALAHLESLGCVRPLRGSRRRRGAGEDDDPADVPRRRTGRSNRKK